MAAAESAAEWLGNGPGGGSADRYDPFTRAAQRGRATRPWIASRGPRKARATTFVFRLARPARVRVAVVQVAPACRPVGAFTVRGHAGVNRVAFGGRVRGRPLPIGTYRVIGKARGRTVLRVTLVVAAGAPSARALAGAKAANACAVILSSVAVWIPTQVRGPVGTSAGGSARSQPTVREAGEGSSVGTASEASVLPRARVLGAQFGKSAGGVNMTHALLVTAAAIAILLLALAALPEAALADARLAALVETRRIELALGGASTLLAAVLVYLGSG